MRIRERTSGNRLTTWRMSRGGRSEKPWGGVLPPRRVSLRARAVAGGPTASATSSIVGKSKLARLRRSFRHAMRRLWGVVTEGRKTAKHEHCVSPRLGSGTDPEPCAGSPWWVRAADSCVASRHVSSEGRPKSRFRYRRALFSCFFPTP